MSIILAILGIILFSYFFGAIICLLIWLAVIAGVIYACVAGGPAVGIPAAVILLVIFVNLRIQFNKHNKEIEKFSNAELPDLMANISKLKLMLTEVKDLQSKLGHTLRMVNRDPDDDRDFREYSNLIERIENKVLPSLYQQRDDAYVAYVKKSLTNEWVYTNKIKEIQSTSNQETQNVINIYNSIRTKISRNSFFN